MSVTLNLTHTFETRVVYSTEEIEAVREVLQETIENGEKADLSKMTPKRRGEVKASLNVCAMAASMNDDDLIFFLTKQAFKQGVKSELESCLKELKVTRMSPIQSKVVRSFAPAVCGRCEVTKVTMGKPCGDCV